jgi:hypothetical protein
MAGKRELERFARGEGFEGVSGLKRAKQDDPGLLAELAPRWRAFRLAFQAAQRVEAAASLPLPERREALDGEVHRAKEALYTEDTAGDPEAPDFVTWQRAQLEDGGEYYKQRLDERAPGAVESAVTAKLEEGSAVAQRAKELAHRTAQYGVSPYPSPDLRERLARRVRQGALEGRSVEDAEIDILAEMDADALAEANLSGGLGDEVFSKVLVRVGEMEREAKGERAEAVRGLPADSRAAQLEALPADERQAVLDAMSVDDLAAMLPRQMISRRVNRAAVMRGELHDPKVAAGLKAMEKETAELDGEREQ